VSIKEFGRGFTAGELGTYDPVEHIDNPTDLRASDVNRQVAPGADGAAALRDPSNPDAYRPTADVLAQSGRHGPAGLRVGRPPLLQDYQRLSQTRAGS